MENEQINKQWTNTDIMHLKSMMNENASIRVISIKLNRTKTSVLHKMYKLGISAKARNYKFSS